MNKTANSERSPWSDVGEDGASLTVHDFLTVRFSAAMGIMRREVTQPYAKELGLTIPEWRILSLIAHAGVLPFGELVIQSASDKALVSRRLRSLEERGLVIIRPETALAKKKLACEVTAQGQALYDRGIVLAREKQAQALNILTKKERETLWRILHKLESTLPG